MEPNNQASELLFWLQSSLESLTLLNIEATHFVQLSQSDSEFRKETQKILAKRPNKRKKTSFCEGEPQKKSRNLFSPVVTEILKDWLLANLVRIN